MALQEQPLSRLALFPGTFDPITLGHMDILERAQDVFDRVEIAVAESTSKQTLFSLEERSTLIEACVERWAHVTVGSFSGLLVDYARMRKASVIIRGMRQVTDFDYEQRMAFANHRLAPELQTVFFMTSEAHALVSASLVREIHRWSGDVSSFVPQPVIDALASKRIDF
jgi:pantetheine-phosphate adenylyltransferase